MCQVAARRTYCHICVHITLRGNLFARRGAKLSTVYHAIVCYAFTNFDKVSKLPNSSVSKLNVICFVNYSSFLVFGLNLA